MKDIEPKKDPTLCYSVCDKCHKELEKEAKERRQNYFTN
jgi:hypothetical protein